MVLKIQKIKIGGYAQAILALLISILIISNYEPAKDFVIELVSIIYG